MNNSLTRTEMAELLKKAKDLEQTLTLLMGAKEAFNVAVYNILQELNDE